MKTESVNEHLIGKTYDQIIPLLAFDEDQGDCCGFARWDKIGDRQLPADIDTSLLVLEGCALIDYADHNTARIVHNFVFNYKGDKVILGYELIAGSGSGWAYGAYVKMSLDNETLAEVWW